MKKQIIGGLLVGLLVIGCGIAFVLQDKKTQKPELENKVENNVVEEIKETSPEPAVQEVKPVQPVQEPKKIPKEKSTYIRIFRITCFRFLRLRFLLMRRRMYGI